MLLAVDHKTLQAMAQTPPLTKWTPYLRARALVGNDDAMAVAGPPLNGYDPRIEGRRKQLRGRRRLSADIYAGGRSHGRLDLP